VWHGGHLFEDKSSCVGVFGEIGYGKSQQYIRPSCGLWLAFGSSSASIDIINGCEMWGGGPVR